MVYATPRTRFRLRLINPNSPLTTLTMPDVIQRMTLSRRAIFAPTGLTICAAVAPPHWDVEVIDECVLGSPHVPRADCDVVGITAMTTQARRAYEIADAYRALGVTVIMGGIHPSAMPEDALEHCDAVCKGDGESTLPHLLADWEEDRRDKPGGSFTGGSFAGGLVRGEGHSSSATGPGRKMKRVYDWSEYDSAPIGSPRKDLLDPRHYLVANPIQTTRGCPHSCSFCTTPGVFGRKFRQRNIADIVDEIRDAKERHNSWCFIFADDDFGGNHKWALEMCAALEPLNIAWASQCDILISRNDKLLEAMRRSGCVGLILGLESRKQDTLSEAGKRFVKADSYEWRIRKIQSYGISLWGAFIFGFDHDTWPDLMFACRWAQRMDLCMSCYPILTPYPGTEFWREFERAGRITTRDWDRFNGASVVYSPRHLSPRQLRHAQMAAFAEFYSVRSALRRLKVWPLKGRAWTANLGIAKGIRYYYRKRRRHVPRFRDFLDPHSPAWNYRDARDDSPSLACCGPSPNLAELAVAQSDPFHQAGQALAALNPLMAAARGRPAAASIDSPACNR